MQTSVLTMIKGLANIYAETKKQSQLTRHLCRSNSGQPPDANALRFRFCDFPPQLKRWLGELPWKLMPTVHF